MNQYKILNSRERKEIRALLERQFGAVLEIEQFILKNTEGRLFILSRGYEKIDPSVFRINSRGMYFGKLERDGLRLSIEGAQYIRPTKNIVSLTKDQASAWMQGEDIPFEGEDGYIVVRYKKDILGCGRRRKGIIHNMIPKERRLKRITE